MARLKDWEVDVRDENISKWQRSLGENPKNLGVPRESFGYPRSAVHRCLKKIDEPKWAKSTSQGDAIPLERAPCR